MGKSTLIMDSFWDNKVGESYRFTYQENQFYGECMPCTAAVFNRLIDSPQVKYNIDTRQAVEKAISEGTPLDSFVQSGDFLKFCQKEESKQGTGPQFLKLTTTEKLLRWTNWLKSSLPTFIFGVTEFVQVPKLDKNKQAVMDINGNPVMYRRRLASGINQLSGLFMYDADHLAMDPRELFQRTQVAGFPWQVRLAHKTSSGQGLRLVCEARLEVGNIADNQIELARELGVLEMAGTTGKPVTDNSCIDATRISYCPRREDIYFIDNKLFNLERNDG